MTYSFLPVEGLVLDVGRFHVLFNLGGGQVLVHKSDILERDFYPGDIKTWHIKSFVLAS